MPKTVRIPDIDDEVYGVLVRLAGEAGITVPELMRREATKLAQRTTEQAALSYAACEYRGQNSLSLRSITVPTGNTEAMQMLSSATSAAHSAGQPPSVRLVRIARISSSRVIATSTTCAVVVARWDARPAKPRPQPQPPSGLRRSRSHGSCTQTGSPGTQ